jgi:hypothetical protein
VFALTKLVYYRHYRRADLFLTFFALNLIIFLITFFMNRVQMSMGAAFGLFAVFSMLRYRTEETSAKDMTYIFLVIGLGLLMAISPIGSAGLLLTGALIVACAYFLEGDLIVRRELAQDVWYDNIKLVGVEMRPQLISDLRARTGLDIHRVDVRQVDFLKDAARLTVYHYGNG